MGIPQDVINMFVIIGIIFLVLIIFIILIVSSAYAKKRNSLNREINEYNALYAGKIIHFNGLPIASKVEIFLLYTYDRLIFKNDSQEITLGFNKINDMQLVSGENAKTNAAIGAIAGNLIFGGYAGATVGLILTTNLYLIISYDNGNDNKSIILEPSTLNFEIFQKMVTHYKNNYRKELKQIEL
jgi:hypothetical protein